MLVATINTLVDTHTGDMSGIVSGTLNSQEKRILGNRMILMPAMLMLLYLG